MPRLHGKIALVTGAASGIGAAIVARLLEDGATVVATDLAPPVAGHLALALDTADEAAWIAAMDATLDAHGRLDILVNNAGVSARAPGPISEVTLEDWRRVMSVNLDGVFLGMKHAIRAMTATGGSIVNIASMLSFVAIRNSPAYCASKGGVLQLTRAGALEGAAMTPPVRVNAVHPGYVETPLLASRLAQRPGMREDLEARTPLGRLAAAAEIASAVAYLASDDSGYMTGSSMAVDGGFMAQ